MYVIGWDIYILTFLVCENQCCLYLVQFHINEREIIKILMNEKKTKKHEQYLINIFSRIERKKSN